MDQGRKNEIVLVIGGVILLAVYVALVFYWW